MQKYHFILGEAIGKRDHVEKGLYGKNWEKDYDQNISFAKYLSKLKKKERKRKKILTVIIKLSKV